MRNLLTFILITLTNLVLSQKINDGNKSFRPLNSIDSSLFRTGTFTKYNEKFYYSDFENNCFYEIENIESDKPIITPLLFYNGKDLFNKGYLFRDENFYYILNHGCLNVFTLDYKKSYSCNLKFRYDGLKYHANYEEETFKIRRINDEFIVPVSVSMGKSESQHFKEVYSKSKCFFRYSTKGDFLGAMGNYDTLFSKLFLVNELRNKLSLRGDTSCELISGELAVVKSYGNKSQKTFLKYPVKLGTDYDENDKENIRENLNHQLIESTNVSDFIFNENAYYVLLTEPITDTCVIGNPVLKNFKGCSVLSIKAQNQGLQLLNKKSVLLKFDFNGNLLSKRQTNVSYSSEILQIENGYIYLYNRNSRMGGPTIYKYLIE
ncbi:MAG: hypothetical protein WCK82_09880 [Bacteroidota bacterium]